MENKQAYSVSDLATALNLPRTTINDWLGKYARFLDTELKGKRKVYSVKSLQVLQDIAKFRNDGVQLVDIDKLLEEKYGMHGEIQVEKMTKKSDEKNVNDGETATTELAVNNAVAQEMTVLVKNQFEELLLGLEKANQQRNSAIRRTHVLFIMLLLLIFILIGAGGFLGVKLIHKLQDEQSLANQKISQQYKTIEDDLSQNFAKNKQDINALSNKTSEDLENIVTKLNSKDDELRKELVKQQNELKLLLEELKKENKSLETEAIKNREDFAKKQLELLENMKKNQEELEKIRTDLDKSREVETQLREKIQKLEDEKKELVSQKSDSEQPIKEVKP
jgi:DNA repair exonuclease SbcCD ATPase subunit